MLLFGYSSTPKLTQMESTEKGEGEGEEEGEEEGIGRDIYVQRMIISVDMNIIFHFNFSTVIRVHSRLL